MSDPRGDLRILQEQEQDQAWQMGQAIARSQATHPQPSPPKNVEVPALLRNGAIDDTVTVGDSLVCTVGIWEGEPSSYTYQWYDGEKAVGDGTDSYTVATGDTSINCVVTAVNAYGSAAAPPSNTVTVAPPLRQRR